MTDFDLRLEEILKDCQRATYFPIPNKVKEQLKALFAVTVLKIIGEDEARDNSDYRSELNIANRKELRTELRASLQNILGRKI